MMRVFYQTPDGIGKHGAVNQKAWSERMNGISTSCTMS